MNTPWTLTLKLQGQSHSYRDLVLVKDRRNHVMVPDIPIEYFAEYDCYGFTYTPTIERWLADEIDKHRKHLLGHNLVKTAAFEIVEFQVMHGDQSLHVIKRDFPVSCGQTRASLIWPQLTDTYLQHQLTQRETVA